MADFTVRSDGLNVEQIMEQIRARIREKRGVDYTEAQIRELAAVKLQKFLDPRGVRSDLLEQFKKSDPPPDLPNYSFEENTLFDTHRGVVRFFRRLLLPIFKLFWNPNPLIHALNIQSRVNSMLAARDTSRRATEALYYELIHNLVLETTRLGIEVKNLTMRVESLSSRLEFNERRARSLESVVVYKAAPDDVYLGSRAHAPQASAGSSTQSSASPAASATPPGGHAPVASQASHAPTSTHGSPGAGGPPGEGPGQRSRRRRRRRGRRGGPPAATVMGGAAAPGATTPGGSTNAPAATSDNAAREAGEASHSAAAEGVEHAMGGESHPSEPDVTGGPGGDDGSHSQ